MIGGGAILQVAILSFGLVDEDSENVGPDPKPYDERIKKEEMIERESGRI
jgi:hypothetical protein